jgi:hypothetical protein
MGIITQGYVDGNSIVTSGFSSGTAYGNLFDNVVAALEKTPSETLFKPGLFQPGLFTECRLLSNNISNLEKQPSPFFKAGFFQPGLFSECKLLVHNISEFEKT